MDSCSHFRFANLIGSKLVESQLFQLLGTTQLIAFVLFQLLGFPNLRVVVGLEGNRCHKRFLISSRR